MTIKRIRISHRERRGLDPSEHIEARRFMDMVRLHEKQYPALKWLHAIPNGGWRNKTVAAKLKAEGVRPGVHDYGWPYKQQGFSGLYIELKSLTGSPSREQKDFGVFAAMNGFQVQYCRGWVAAWKAVCDYAGIPFQVA